MRTRAEQIAAIRGDQQFWRGLAAEVGPDRYSEPGPMGEWSFGDLAGHLLGWRVRTIERLQALAQGDPEPAPPWPAELDAEDDVDRINDWIRARYVGRTPAQLVADYDATYDRIIAILESLPESRLNDLAIVPWLGVALVTVDFTGHLHDEHVPDVRAWLDANR
jgi:hypothetical protein